MFTKGAHGLGYYMDAAQAVRHSLVVVWYDLLLKVDFGMPNCCMGEGIAPAMIAPAYSEGPSGREQLPQVTAVTSERVSRQQLSYL